VANRNESFADQLTFASQASVDERADFIGKTYLHLGGAILAFAGLTALILSNEQLSMGITQLMFGNGNIGYLIFFACFVGGSWIAQMWAQSETSQAMQYVGLGLYVVLQSIIFTPLLLFAQAVAGPELITTAGVLTIAVFAGLSIFVFITRYNFSFLGPALGIISLAILGVFVVAILVPGFNLSSLGVWLPVGMVVLASLYILYDTSNVLHQYRIGQHVAASLALFASVALLFWWMIRLLMSLQRND
jgi:FtsH-binding integral membrane protein